MSLAPKVSLKKALSQTENIDPLGLSPFIALHLQGLDHIHLHRTSAVGFVETVGAPDPQDPGWVFVSHNHLQDCLRCIESIDVEVVVLPHGGVLIRSVNSAFETELRVHTVERSRAAMRRHNPGPTFVPLAPEWLSGFDIRKFNLVTPPVVYQDKLLMRVSSGLIAWTSVYSPDVPSSPRESFLRAIAGMTQGTLELTDLGFYRAVVDGMHICTASHRSDYPSKDMVLATVQAGGVNLPGGRLVQALSSGLTMASTNSTILLSPKSGVTTRDDYGNPGRWSLGDVGAFDPVNLTLGTARMLVDALGQVSDEFAVLDRIGGCSDWFRLTRGPCAVSFRVP